VKKQAINHNSSIAGVVIPEDEVPVGNITEIALPIQTTTRHSRVLWKMPHPGRRK